MRSVTIMQAIQWSGMYGMTAPVRRDGALSVRTGTPAADVVALLTEHQVRAVAVVDEYGVPVGIVSMADLLAGDDVDPIFAGLARRRWYDLPDGATAGDLMVRIARLPGRRRIAA